MKSVWRELSKIEFERPEVWDKQWIAHLTDQEAAFTQIFWNVYYYASYPAYFVTVSELDDLRTHCEDTAKKLREAAGALRRVPYKNAIAAIHQYTFYYEDYGVTNERVAEACAKIEDVTKFCDSLAAETIELEKSFVVIDRPGRHRTVRGYVLILASLISKPLYGTLATIASVALNCDVSKQQVIDWTRGVKAS